MLYLSDIIDKLTIEYLADHNYISDNNKLEGHSKYSLNDLNFIERSCEFG